jgi:hypothetical protein
MIASFREDVAARRRSRAARKSLEHDVASYTSPTDRLELDMLLERHDEAETADLRRAIARTRAA